MPPNVPDFPERLEIELVSDCNLRCTYCPRHHMNELTGYMDPGLFGKIIDEASAHPETKLVLHRRGESMLHPQFVPMLQKVAGKFADVQMATNGTMLRPEFYEAIVNGLTFLSFSLDEPTAYNATRVGADYAKVERKLLDFLDYNQGRVRTQASMVQTDQTPLENCERFKEIWTGRVDRVRIYQEHSKDGAFGSIQGAERERQPCVMPFYEMLVYDSGQVGRCNHDWNGSPLGDLNTASIAGVWHSQAYVKLRQEHVSENYDDPVCAKCDSWYPEVGNQGTGEVVEK